MPHMPLQVIFRDDDCSFFTRQDILEKLYSKLWETGKPVSLSVIPKHTTSKIMNPYVSRLLETGYDKNIDPKYYGSNKNYSIKENASLCRFLREKLDSGLLEITMHGLNHNNEFMSRDISKLKDIINEARLELKSIFPMLNLSTVVIPYESSSPECIDLIIKEGLNLSTIKENFYTRRLFERIRFRYFNFKIFDMYKKSVIQRGNSKIFFGFHLFSHGHTPDENIRLAKNVFHNCMKNRQVFILVNHYHYFFKDWNIFNNDMVNGWHSFLDYVLDHDIEVTTFEQCRI